MDSKYTIFVSSTYIDLKEEREEIRNAIIKMGHIPVGMEYFPASNKTQWEIIKKLIDECDYYVLIIGGRYGSIEKESKDQLYTKGVSVCYGHTETAAYFYT